MGVKLINILISVIIAAYLNYSSGASPFTPNNTITTIEMKSIVDNPTESGNGNQSMTLEQGQSKTDGSQQREKRGYYYYQREPSHFQQQGDRYTQKGGLGTRMLNKFRRRTNNLVNAAGAIATAHEHYGDGEGEEGEDNQMSGTFWNMYSQGGYGGYGKSVNKSAVGLLGFLSLLSLIQTALTTTTTVMGRSAREMEMGGDMGQTQGPSQSQRITEILLPMLTLVSQAGENKRMKIECVLNEVCLSSEALVKEFGDHGKSVGIMMGDALSKMLKEKKRTVEESVRLRYAASAGRNRPGSCNSSFPPCAKF